MFDQVFPQIRCVAVSRFAFCTTNVAENTVCAELWKGWTRLSLFLARHTAIALYVCACWSDVTAGVTSHGLCLFLPLTQMCSGDEIWHQLIFVNWSLVGAVETAQSISKKTFVNFLHRRSHKQSRNLLPTETLTTLQLSVLMDKKNIQTWFFWLRKNSPWTPVMLDSLCTALNY